MNDVYFHMYIHTSMYTVSVYMNIHSFIFISEVGVLDKDVVWPKSEMAVLVLSSETVRKQHNHVVLCDLARLAKCTVSKRNVVMFCHC